MGYIPQTVIVRYHDMSVVCLHTNTKKHTLPDSETHIKECTSCLDRKFVTVEDSQNNTQSEKKKRFQVQQLMLDGFYCVVKDLMDI